MGATTAAREQIRGRTPEKTLASGGGPSWLGSFLRTRRGSSAPGRRFTGGEIIAGTHSPNHPQLLHGRGPEFIGGSHLLPPLGMRLVGGSSFQTLDVKTVTLGGGVIGHGPGRPAIPPEGPLAGINHLVLGEEVEHLLKKLQKIRRVNNFHKNQSIISGSQA